jgi:hypothetical protein
VIRRTARIVSWSLGALAAVVATAVGLFAWRLAQGPIVLDALLPAVERALSDPDGRFTVSIGEVALSWADDEAPGATGASFGHFDVRALRVRVLGGSGAGDGAGAGELAAVPELGLGFSASALLTGRLAPTRLVLVGPRVAVIRRADGSVGFDIRGHGEAGAPVAEVAGDAGDDAPLAAGILDALRLPPDARRPLGLLTRVTVSGAGLTLDDRVSGTRWRASHAEVTLRRNPGGITGRAKLGLDLAGRPASVEADGAYRIADGVTEVGMRLAGVAPAALAGLAPELAPLAAASLLVGGRVEATLDAGFQPRVLRADLTAGAGSLAVPAALRPDPVPLNGARLRAAVDLAGRRLTLDEAWVQIGPPGEAGSLRVTAEGTLAAPAPGAAPVPTGDVRLTLMDGHHIGLAQFGLARRESGSRVTVQLAGFEPAALAGLAPALAPLAAARLPVGGDVEMELDDGLQPLSGRVDLYTGAGQVAMPQRFSVPLAMAGAALTAEADRTGVTVHELALDLGGPRILVGGEARVTGGQLQVRVAASAGAVPLDDLARLWPRGVAEKVRVWIVANLAHGIVDEAHVDMTGSGPLDALADFDADRLDMSLRGRDATVTYFRPLPPIAGVNCDLVSDRHTMTIRTHGGVLGDVRMGDGLVVIGDLGGHEDIDIQAPVQGSLRTILTVLNSPPLEYPKKLDLEPKRTAGTAEAKLHFYFPLVDDLNIDDVNLTVTGRLHDAVAEDVVAGMDVTDGALAVALDTKSMTVKGKARLDGIPIVVDWQEAFQATAKGPRTRIAAKGVADAAIIRRFGLEPLPYARGPVVTDAVLTVDQQHRLAVAFRLDFAGTTLAFPLLGWTKPPGTPGSGRMTLEFEKDRLRRIAGLTVEANGLNAAGTVELDQRTGHFARFDLSQLRLGRTRLTGEVLGRPDGGYSVSLAGEGLEAQELTKGHSGQDGGTGATATGATATGATATGATATGATATGATATGASATGAADDGQRPMDIALRIDRVYFGKGDEGKSRQLTGVSGRLRHDGRAWTGLNLNAGAGAKGALKLRYGPAGDHWDLDLSVDDAGEVLRMMDLTDRVQNGTLHAVGRTREARADAPVEGHMELQDYALTDIPVLARILNAVSPSGLAELLDGKGVTFGRLAGDFRKEGPLLRFRNVRTSGSALGLTLEGHIDRDAETANLRGTIVPVYGLNRLLGQIPVLGDALSGGAGQGLFAATWHVQGPLANPGVSVNPLAVLAPGFLRNLFFMGAGDTAVGTPWEPAE